MTIQPTPQEFTPFQGNVRELRIEDLPQLKPILETWIKHRETKEPLPEEVTKTLQNMEESIGGKNERHYLVAETEEGQTVGVVGIKKPDKIMTSFTSTPNPTELVNFFIVSSERGKGLGKILAANLENYARSLGHTEIVLNSGPRYKETAWDFYDRLPGFKRIGIAKEYYGKEGDAPVWKKIL